MTSDIVEEIQTRGQQDEGLRISIPDLTFTIAITGHRSIRPDSWDGIRDRIAALLADCGRRLEQQRAASPLDRARTPTTRFLTALAAGADQIGAEAALAAGWELDVLIPYHESAYVGALHEGLDPQLPARFPVLRDKASSVFELDDWTHGPGELDGEAAYWRDRRYWTLGQMLVRQADLLIAVWRGGPPVGPGGTANVVGEAHRVGLPVIWIDPDDGTLRVIAPDPATANDNILTLVRRAEGEDKLDALLEATITPLLAKSLLTHPPQPAAGIIPFTGTTALLAEKRGWGHRLFGVGKPERIGRKSWAVAYQFFFWFMLLFARQDGRALRSWNGLLVKLDGGESIWLDPSRPQDAVLRNVAINADLVATARAHIYRSGYLLIFLLSAAAVFFSLFGLVVPGWKPGLVSIELAALLAILGIHFWARHHEWHTRWINSRHLTESLRGIRLTAWVGFAGRRPANADAPWSMWFANAIAANAVLGDRRITIDEIAALTTAIKAVVRDQEGYNESNKARLKTLHRRLETAGAVCVAAAGLVALGYLVTYALFNEHHHDWVAFAKIATTVLGGVLPAVAAALAGIRYHGDFERFAERSHQTALQLRQIDGRLDRLHGEALACDGPCSNRAPLYETLLDITLATQAIFEDDLQDWRFVYAARPTPGI